MYARWDALDNDVTFNSKGGSAVTATVFPSGGTVSAPTAPTRSGYTFAGWSATDGGSVITFPYAPGVVTDITLFAKWNLVSTGSSGSSGNNSAGSNSGSNNVTVIAPLTVTGNKAANVPTIEVQEPVKGSNAKPVGIKIDAASEKYIAEAKVVEGKLVLKPETGFSGKKNVLVTITENGVDRMIQIPITVLPDVVSKPVVEPVSATKTTIKWVASPNASSYKVFVNSKQICLSTTTSCVAKTVLGPNSVVEIVSNGGDRTISEKMEAALVQQTPVVIDRIFSANITSGALGQKDINALNKVANIITTQGFTTVVISKIVTTSKTSKIAAARVEAIKSYLQERVSGISLTFEVVPSNSKTYFNNIALKS